MPRPDFQITDKVLKQVEQLAAQGLTHEQIAYSIGCVPSCFYRKKIIKKELREAIDRGKAKGIATISNSLFTKAKNGDTQAIKYYLNNRDPSNWSEKKDTGTEVTEGLVTVLTTLISKLPN